MMESDLMRLESDLLLLIWVVCTSCLSLFDPLELRRWNCDGNGPCHAAAPSDFGCYSWFCGAKPRDNIARADQILRLVPAESRRFAGGQ